MSVREFSLMNEVGQKYSLMDIENYCLLTDPSGLGYSYSTTYEQLGNTFVENVRQIAQTSISGIANFAHYDNFKNLIDFIENAELLRFVYVVPYKDKSTKTFYKDVNIQSITKTQKATNGILSETITFDMLSLWYEENTKVYNLLGSDEEDVIRWDFTWDSYFLDYNTRALNYINSGHTFAAILVSINGYIENPQIDLYVEGELYQAVKFNVTLEENEKLLYCSKENNFYILKQNTDGTTESLFKLDVIDFDNDNVIRLPQNKSCELIITGDTEVSNAQITVYPYYKAV